MKLRVLTGLLAGLAAYLFAVITGLACLLPLESVLLKGLKSLVVFGFSGAAVCYLIQQIAGRDRKETAGPTGEAQEGEAEGSSNSRDEKGTGGKSRRTGEVTGRTQSEAGRQQEAAGNAGKEPAGEGNGSESSPAGGNFQPLDLPVLEVEGE